MHMADALISPAVGGTAWAASVGLIGYSSRKLRGLVDGQQIPLMGVLGAFVFAAQMINFTIPATGSSGHLGGGLMLAVLLGPSAAFLTVSSVLIVQALFFADGGLLALGCNIFNLGFFPCFLAYPLIYSRIAGDHSSRGRVIGAAMISAVVALQLGSLAVVTQTSLSGISDLPFTSFALVMQPIHLAIGLVEGAATAAVVLFVLNVRPELITGDVPGRPGSASLSLKGLAAVFVAAAVITGGGLSLLASRYPDGLEWSISRVSRQEELPRRGEGVHDTLAALQEKTSVLPDYALKDGAGTGPGAPPAWWGTSISGLAGGALTLLLAGLMWFAFSRKRKPS